MIESVLNETIMTFCSSLKHVFHINFNQTRPHYKKYVVFTWFEHAKNSSRVIKQKESLQIPSVMKTKYEQ